MRHRVEGRKLNRTASHRSALLRSLTTSLLRHKRIKTTEAKAKEARRYAEAIITRAKRAVQAEAGNPGAGVHARRVVAREIHDRKVLQELFSEIAQKVADRPGGYTRVVKLGTRSGDGARMAVLELVDYNLDRDESAARSKSRKGISRAERVARSRAKQAEKKAAQKAAAATEEVTAAAEQVEETAEEVVDVTEAVETPAAGETPSTEETASKDDAAAESGNEDDDKEKPSEG